MYKYSTCTVQPGQELKCVQLLLAGPSSPSIPIHPIHPIHPHPSSLSTFHQGRQSSSRARRAAVQSRARHAQPSTVKLRPAQARASPAPAQHSLARMRDWRRNPHKNTQNTLPYPTGYMPAGHSGGQTPKTPKTPRMIRKRDTVKIEMAREFPRPAIGPPVSAVYPQVPTGPARRGRTTCAIHVRYMCAACRSCAAEAPSGMAIFSNGSSARPGEDSGPPPPLAFLQPAPFLFLPLLQLCPSVLPVWDGVIMPEVLACLPV